MDPEITLIPPPEGLKKMESLNKYLNIYSLEETANEFFITFTHGTNTDSPILAIFNKSGRELVFLEHEEAGRYGMVNDLDGGLAFWPRRVYNDSVMIDYLDAYEIVEYYENHSEDASMKPFFRDMAENLNINDNPVLVVTKIK
jgi:hypothetical protein